MTSRTSSSRRDFVKSAGGLLIGFSIADSLVEIAARSGSSAASGCRTGACRTTAFEDRVVASNCAGRRDHGVHGKGGDRDGRERRAHADRRRRTGRAHETGDDDHGRHHQAHPTRAASARATRSHQAAPRSATSLPRCAASCCRLPLGAWIRLSISSRCRRRGQLEDRRRRGRSHTESWSATRISERS